MATVDKASVPEDRPGPGIDRRIEAIVDDDADLASVAEALASRRDRILARWLAVASAQPFHTEHPDGAVADHLPALVDAITAVLRQAVRRGDVVAPMDDAAVIEAARSHAQARFEQGLGPVAVATEFRLLRHEISRALADVVDMLEPRDILAGQAIVDDALDGAATIGLEALSGRIESLRDELLATTLHDIRQPVTLLTGSLDLVARWLAEPSIDRERLMDVVDGAVVAAGEVTAMLDTLGDATRIAMGALEPEREPADLQRVVAGAIALLEPDARARVAVRDRTRTRLLGLWDSTLLRRVIINLVGNGLKYSPPRSPVEVVLERVGEDAARMSVIDQGIGLAPGEAEALFERFVRGDRARDGRIPGLGLGLYACRGIVIAHGGTIELSSDGPDTGTRVDVVLPLFHPGASDEV